MSKPVIPQSTSVTSSSMLGPITSSDPASEVSFDIEGVPATLSANVHRVPDMGATATGVKPPKEGPIRIGTTAGGTFLANQKLGADNTERQNMEKAYKEILDKAKGVYGDGLVNMQMNLDRARFYFKFKNCNVLDVTFEEFQEQLANQNGQPLDQVQADFLRCCSDIDAAFAQAGISTVSHYSPTGPNTRGSKTGGEAFDERRITNGALIHSGETTNLYHSASAEKGKFIDGGHGIYDFVKNNIENDRPGAIQKFVRAEAFEIALRKNILKAINKYHEKIKNNGESDTEKAKKLNDFKRRLKILEHFLTAKLNKTALMQAAIYQNLGENPVESAKMCYEAVKNHYYMAAWERSPNKDLFPTQEEFYKEPYNWDYLERAADTASMLIDTRKDYDSFCSSKSIAPKDNHINQFVLSALKKEHNFDNLNVPLNQDERDCVSEVIQETLTQVNDGLPDTSTLKVDNSHLRDSIKGLAQSALLNDPVRPTPGVLGRFFS